MLRKVIFVFILSSPFILEASRPNMDKYSQPIEVEQKNNEKIRRSLIEMGLGKILDVDKKTREFVDEKAPMRLEALYWVHTLNVLKDGIEVPRYKKLDEKTETLIPLAFNNILEKVKEDLLSKGSEEIRAAIVSNKNTTYFLSVKDKDVVTEKFMTKHKVKGNDDTEKFDTSDESDGTNRIIDFIPLLMDLLKGDNVFIIDEMERSLHPNLIYDLLDLFLSKAKNINSQLILASHESSLLTQKLLRKDEIWFVVKNKFGTSQLHSLEEYNVRFDKEIRKDYLLGRFKAIPKIGNRNNLTVLNN